MDEIKINMQRMFSLLLGSFQGLIRIITLKIFLLFSVKKGLLMHLQKCFEMIQPKQSMQAYVNSPHRLTYTVQTDRPTQPTQADLQVHTCQPTVHTGRPTQSTQANLHSPHRQTYTVHTGQPTVHTGRPTQSTQSNLHSPHRQTYTVHTGHPTQSTQADLTSPHRLTYTV